MGGCESPDARRRPVPLLRVVTGTAERDQVVEVVFGSAVLKTDDVMDLELVGRAATPTPIAVASSCCCSSLLPACGRAGPSLPRCRVTPTLALRASRAARMVSAADQAVAQGHCISSVHPC